MGWIATYSLVNNNLHMLISLSQFYLEFGADVPKARTIGELTKEIVISLYLYNLKKSVWWLLRTKCLNNGQCLNLLIHWK